MIIYNQDELIIVLFRMNLNVKNIGYLAKNQEGIIFTIDANIVHVY